MSNYQRFGRTTNRFAVRLLVMLLIAGNLVSLSPVQAEIVGEQVRSDLHSAFTATRDLLNSNRLLKPKPQQPFAAQQEKSPEDRAADVHKLRLCPRKLTLYVGEEFALVPLALNRNDEAVQGAKMAWSSSKPDTVTVNDSGDVTAIAAGHAQVVVQSGNARAHVNVEVRAGVRRRQSDAEWDEEHANDCDQPESSQLRREENDSIATTDEADDEATSDSRDVQATGRRFSKAALRTTAPRLNAKKAALTKATAGSNRAGGYYYLVDPLDGSSGDSYAGAAAAPLNATGNPRFAPMEASDGPTKTKNNLANYNYNFTAPVLSLGGRNSSVDLALIYNSRLWSKEGSTIIFNYNKGYPAAGWSIGYGRMVPNYDNTATGDASGSGSANSPGNYLLIQPDGTRIHLRPAYDSTSGLWTNYSDGNGHLKLNPRNRRLTYSDGTQVNYTYTNNRLLPTLIRTRNGSRISIAYRTYSGSAFKIRWAIDYITDSLGRVVTFNYDASAPTPKLTAVSGPDQSGGTRTYVKIDYTTITVQHNFNLTQDANNPTNGSSLTVVSRISYPATGRGYLFEDYSAYGMPRKISVRKDMNAGGGAIGDGTEIAFTKYYYTTSNASDPYGRNQSGTLNDAPQYDQRHEYWQGKTDDSGNPTSAANIYTYARTAGTDTNGYPTEIDTVTYPTNAQGTMQALTTTGNDPTNAPDVYGKVISVESKIQGGASLGKTVYSYTNAADGSLQVGSVEVTNNGSPTQTAKTTYDYGNYGRLANVYEYGFTGSVQRRTKYSYSDDFNHLDLNMLYLVTQVAVYNSSGTKVAQTDYSYDNYTVKGGMETYGLTAASYPPGHTSTFDETSTNRGNVTGMTNYITIGGASITRYSKYDIFGNVTEADVSCCQVKTFNYRTDALTSPDYYSQPYAVMDGRDGTVPFLKEIVSNVVEINFAHP